MLCEVVWWCYWCCVGFVGRRDAYHVSGAYVEDFFSFVIVNARLNFKRCEVICAACV